MENKTVLILSTGAHYESDLREVLTPYGLKVESVVLESYEAIADKEDFYDFLALSGYKPGPLRTIIIDVPSMAVQREAKDLARRNGAEKVFIVPPVLVPTFERKGVYVLEPLLHVPGLNEILLRPKLRFNYPVIDNATALRIKELLRRSTNQRVEVEILEVVVGQKLRVNYNVGEYVINVTGSTDTPYGFLNSETDLLPVGKAALKEAIFNPLSIANEPVLV